MAHFAELDANDNVVRVVVIGDLDCLDSDGNESEDVGIAFCQLLFGPDTRWVQTSYNATIRGKFADIGDHYDSAQDRFLPPPSEPSKRAKTE